jgi:hypothetical protein
VWLNRDAADFVEEARLYPSVKPDSRWWTEDGRFRGLGPLDDFIRYMRSVSELSAGPGLPWVCEGCPDIESVLTKHGPLLYARVQERITERLRALREPESWMAEKDGLDVCLLGLRDPTRVFVKNEGHSEEKILAGRVRLIMNVSFTDIAIERIISDALCYEEVANFGHHPSCTGMGFSDAQGAALAAVIHRPQQDAAKRPRGGDVSAFDWSVSEGALVANALVENHQYGVELDSELALLNVQQARLTARKLLVLGDGRAYVTRDPGAQESGSRKTHSGNSKIRHMAAHMVFGDTAITNGDDDVEWVTDDETLSRPSMYAEVLGWKVEYPAFSDGAVEFCSHLWYADGRFVPTSWPRQLYKLLSHAPSQEHLAQFRYEMRHHPRLEEFTNFVREVWQDRL